MIVSQVGADGSTLAEAGDSGLRTVLRIPLTRNRAQLGLLYAAFLGRSMTRVKTCTDGMIPGEAWEWDFTSRHIEDGLGPLDDEGLLEWHKPELALTFDASPEASREPGLEGVVLICRS
jgi:hypothetical protein